MNLISVIVPAYNVEAYLERCVESIIHQTYSELEIILVDDGSTDRTGILCDQIAQKDDRIIVIHKENGGLSDARNAGLTIAGGEYISFIDSDDYIELDMYENMIAEMIDREVSLVAVGFIVTDVEGNDTIDVAEEKKNLTREQALLNLLEDGKLYPSSVNKLFRKEIFDNLRFAKGIINEDTEIIPKIIDVCDRIVILNKAAYHYVLRKGSITQTDYTLKDFQSLVAYKSIVRVCRKKYVQLYPLACYYELSELNEALTKISNSANCNEFRREATVIRGRMLLVWGRCMRWKELWKRYYREMWIYLCVIILGYKNTYKLMKLKQKIVNS